MGDFLKQKWDANLIVQDEHPDTHRSATPDGLKAVVGLSRHEKNSDASKWHWNGFTESVDMFDVIRFQIQFDTSLLDIFLYFSCGLMMLDVLSWKDDVGFHFQP